MKAVECTVIRYYCENTSSLKVRNRQGDQRGCTAAYWQQPALAECCQHAQQTSHNQLLTNESNHETVRRAAGLLTGW